MFLSLKSATSGQGTQSGWEHSLSKLSGVSSPCICVRVHTRVSLSALEHCANKRCLCHRNQGEKRESLADLLVGKLCSAQMEFAFFSRSGYNLYFPKVWPAQLITKVCFVLWDFFSFNVLKTESCGRKLRLSSERSQSVDFKPGFLNEAKGI